MQCFDLWMSVSLVVNFERHSVRTGSFQAGVVVLAAQHWSTRAGLSHSFSLIYNHWWSDSRIQYICIKQFVHSQTIFRSNIYILKKCDSLQTLKRNESLTSKAGDPPSSAILVVYLDKAEKLPVSQISLPSGHMIMLSSEQFPVSVVELGQSCKCHLSHILQKLLPLPLTLDILLQCGCWLYPMLLNINFPLCYFLLHTQKGAADTICCIKSSVWLALMQIYTSWISHVMWCLSVICTVAMVALISSNNVLGEL